MMNEPTTDEYGLELNEQDMEAPEIALLDLKTILSGLEPLLIHEDDDTRARARRTGETALREALERLTTGRVE